jgi:hypothetical protein
LYSRKWIVGTALPDCAAEVAEQAAAAAAAAEKAASVVAAGSVIDLRDGAVVQAAHVGAAGTEVGAAARASDIGAMPAGSAQQDPATGHTFTLDDDDEDDSLDLSDET